MEKYKRNLKELTSKAILNWTEEMILSSEENSSLLYLEKTHGSFIDLLKVVKKDPLSWRVLLDRNEELTDSLFLKHLMILTDLGGEALNKLTPMKNYFPNQEIKFYWKDKVFKYPLKEIGEKCSLTNSVLNVDAKGLLKDKNMTDKCFDVCMLLLFGSQALNDSLPYDVKQKCVVGEYMGKPQEIDNFLRERYLSVSKQVSGATSNNLGQQAQNFVIDHLEKYLGRGWKTEKDSTLPGVSHNEDGGETNFDIVVTSPQKKFFGVEVSFQVTTNSVIERKAREAASIRKSAHNQGHKVCYVIDGAGNINIRKKAINIICNNSDCTVTFTEDEIKLLANFFKSNQ